MLKRYTCDGQPDVWLDTDTLKAAMPQGPLLCTGLASASPEGIRKCKIKSSWILYWLLSLDPEQTPWTREILEVLYNKLGIADEPESGLIDPS